jgi:hypothetical protein
MAAGVRPCTCDKPDCPRCRLFWTRREYRERWGGVWDGPPPPAPPPAARDGSPTATCPECPPGVRLKLNEHLGPDKWLPLLRGPRPPDGWPPGWFNWPAVQEAHRRLAREVADDLPPFPDGRFRGPGVAMMGGGNYWGSTWVSLNMLRDAGCTLPVELFYFGHKGELDEARRAKLGPLGVRCRDLSHLHHLRPFRDGLAPFAAKALAALESSFEWLLWLDADCYPVRDPTFLLSSEELERHGAVFWPDAESERLPRRSWEIFGLEYRDEPAIESGQFCLDKRRWWRPLRLAWHLNSCHAFYCQWRHQRDPARIVYGDKDLWRFAAYLTGQSFSLQRGSPVSNRRAFLHAAPGGTDLFVHRCRNKLRLPGEHFQTTTQAAGGPVPDPGLPGEERAFAHLAALAAGPPAPPPWRPPWKVTVGVPTLNRYDLLPGLAAALRAGTLPPDDIVVIDNGGKGVRLEGVRTHDPGRNLGVAASWNLLIRHAAGPVFVLNDDVRVRPETLERLARAAAADPHSLVFAPAEGGAFRWSCFLARPELEGEVGLFDEELWPAYYEDNDMETRLRLAGRPLVVVPGAPFDHLQTATQRALSPAERAVHQHHFAHNRAYYVSKWGGLGGRERFASPFNEPWDWRGVSGFFDFQALYDAAAARVRAGGTLVEVGCYYGRSLLYLGARAAPRGQRVVGVDRGLAVLPNMERPRLNGARLAANVERAGLVGTVRLMTMDSAEAAALFPDAGLDFVFIDADHHADAVRRDLAAWWPKVAPGGVLAGHDYESVNCPEVKPAVDGFFGRAVPAPTGAGCWWVGKAADAGPDDSLAVVVPTLGRPTLGRALASLGGLRPGDEVIVVADGPRPAARAAWEAGGLPGWYGELPAAAGGWGGPARTFAQRKAAAAWLCYLDDDDAFTPDALATFRRVIRELGHARRPVIFRMAGRPEGTVWRERVIASGNVSSQCLLVPNQPALVPGWGPEYDADSRFAAAACAAYPGGPVWREEVVALWRPE